MISYHPYYTVLPYCMMKMAAMNADIFITHTFIFETRRTLGFYNHFRPQVYACVYVCTPPRP